MDAERIRKMAEYMDESHIARTLGIPVDVVEGVLRGTISEEILKDYDASRPADVRVVEKPRFIRSQIIGVMSPFLYECAEFITELAKESASKVEFPVLLVDLNEFSLVEHTLASKPDGYIYCTVTAYKYSKDLASSTMGFPGQRNLYVMFGVPTTAEELQPDERDIKDLLKVASESAGLVWVNFPTSSTKWKCLYEICDYVLCILKNIPECANLARRLVASIVPSKTVFVSLDPSISGQIRRIVSRTADEDIAVLTCSNGDVSVVLNALGFETKKKKSFLERLLG